MIQTSWPIRRIASYVKRTCSLTPPGCVAVGADDPDLEGLRVGCRRRPRRGRGLQDRCHRHSPLGRRVCPGGEAWPELPPIDIDVMEVRPVRAFRAGRGFRRSPSVVGRRRAGEPGPRRPDALEDVGVQVADGGSRSTSSFRRRRAVASLRPAVEVHEADRVEPAPRIRGAARVDERSAAERRVSGAMACAAIAMPPWSWMLSIVSSSGRSAGMRSLTNSARTWPRRVVISSPTTSEVVARGVDLGRAGRRRSARGR